MPPRRQEAVRLPLPAGGALVGRLSYSAQVEPEAVLFVHGFGSHHAGEKAEALERACARRRWTYAAFDFRGHGQSAGTMLELRGSGLLEDLGRVRDFLAGRGAVRLFPVGSSMGGWAVAWFALDQGGAIPACAAIAPALDFLSRGWDALSEARRRSWRETGRLRVQNDWVDVEIGYGMVAERGQFPREWLEAGWKTPLLIFHGMRDDTVPYAGSLAFVERTPFPEIELRLYKDGDHRLLGYKEEMAEAACAFFARRWQPPPAGRGDGS
jgi:alpha-beta hydrolase superfamily lysophospholipase